MRILIADNDYNFGYVLKKELEEHYHTVDVVMNGFDAIIKFIENKYEFVLLELMLPRLGGEDTCRILNALRSSQKINTKSKIIIIFCDGGKFNRDNLSYGTVKYFKKPFDIKALVQFMEKGNYRKENCEHLKTEKEEMPYGKNQNGTII